MTKVVIYTYQGTNVSVVFYSVLMIILAIICIIGFVSFLPMLKSTVQTISEVIHHRLSDESISAKELVVVSFFIVSLYFVLSIGIVFFSKFAIQGFRTYRNVGQGEVCSGHIQELNYSEIESRGKTIGYRIAFVLEEKAFVIENPPGLSKEALQTLLNNPEVDVYYQVAESSNVVMQILVQDLAN